MPDQAFETRIARVLAAYAEDAVVPIDASRIALAARPERRGLAARVRTSATRTRPSAELRLLFIAAALLLALVVSALLIGGGNRAPQPLLDLAPTPAPSTPVGDIAPTLLGRWVADVPGDLSVGAVEPERMALVVDTNGTQVFLTTTADGTERFRSSLSTAPEDRIVISARVPGEPVTVGGAVLRGCAAGEAGSYAIARSPDRLLLTLAVVDDPCPSRAAVFERTWVRSLVSFSNGGLGVVDAFDPLFTVELPPGSYTDDANVVGAVTISQAVPELQFLAFRDPQGFKDPCNQGAGRREIAPGADAFVAYFRQLEGFTVESVTERIVDGHRAVNLIASADVDAPCDGLVEWQPKASTSDASWFLRRGDTDSLVIVELADATEMFQVLPGPGETEKRVIDSIRFLDQLPTRP